MADRAARQNRLPPHPSQRVDPSLPVHFTYNGKPYSALEGDTIGSALYSSGVRIFSRSFKYHRPRGLMCMTGDCPNCLMTVDGVPNVRTCNTPVQTGMDVRAQNAWPSVEHDALSVMDKLDRLMPVGFYYKSLIRPRISWDMARPLIRRVAGLGKVGADEDVGNQHQHHNLHADVAVVGGGPAGMAAALEAGKGGARVVLIDEGPVLGGHLLSDVSLHAESQEYAGLPGYEVAARLSEQVRETSSIKVLSRASAFGLYPGNLLGVSQGKRLYKIRSKGVIVATGCREVPQLFPGNDLPGVYMGEALRRLMHLYGVAPAGRALVVASEQRGYGLAQELEQAGVQVVGIVDGRRSSPGDDTADGVPVFCNHAIAGAIGVKGVRGALLQDKDSGKTRSLACESIVITGAYEPNSGLLAQTATALTYDSEIQEIVPENIPSTIYVAGDVTGIHDLELTLMQGKAAGCEASQGLDRPTGTDLDSLREAIKAKEQSYRDSLEPSAPPISPSKEAGKTFVCLCEDVTPKDLYQAIDEGFDEMQTLKRYSTLSMGPCQGKMCLRPAIELCSKYTGRTMDETGSTTSRPPLRPLTLGTLAGLLHMPVKRTALHERHVELGAAMADVGPWKRPHSYGPISEEISAVRERVGIIDVSTLGKIDVQGADAPVLLDRVYTHRFSNLPVGRIRYSLLCADNGSIIDDGTITRLAENHYFITTTTANVDLMEEWLKWWNAGWKAKVHINNVTSGYGAINVAGPKARDTLSKLTDVDLSPDAFRYMRSVEGEVAGVPCLFLRIGFVGETGWEMHFPAEYSEHLWDALLDAGREFGIAPFGVEAQRVLRLAKKHIILGQDTDMVSNPLEADLPWVVRLDKDDFIGKHALETLKDRGPREMLVGFVLDEAVVPEDGVPVMHGGRPAGRVTSSRADPSTGRGFGLAWVPAELSEDGTPITIRVRGTPCAARVVQEPFYDPEGVRLRE